MFCTKCGIELRERDKFCCDCGTAAGAGAPAMKPMDTLRRPVAEGKIAGVCAGFARYFGVDVTLVRVIWLALTVWPLPLFGGIAYIVAWIVMPKETATAPAQSLRPVNGSAT